MRQQEVLLYRWTGTAGDEGEEHFAPRPYKSYDLRSPRIRAELAPTAVGWGLTLHAESLALFVAVEAEGMRPSDNCFAVLPGQPRRLYLATDQTAAPAIGIHELHGATCN